MDPNNYPGLDHDQRSDVARALRDEWNRAKQFQNDNQSSADSSFTGAVARGEIGGIGLQTWKDPKTGLRPSGGILQAAIGHDANPIEPVASDIGALANITGDISNRRMSDPGPINQAYLQNQISSRDYQDLSGLYDSYRDPKVSRLFDYAKQAFDARFGDPSSPNGVNPDAINLLPSYLLDLNDAVRNQVDGFHIGRH